MIWFVPLGVVLAVVGTKDSYEQRRFEQSSLGKGWILMMGISWAPILFWVMSQFITQY